MNNKPYLKCTHVKIGRIMKTLSCRECYPVRIVKRYVLETVEESKEEFRAYHDEWGEKFNEIRKYIGRDAAIWWMKKNFH